MDRAGSGPGDEGHCEAEEAQGGEEERRHGPGAVKQTYTCRAARARSRKGPLRTGLSLGQFAFAPADRGRHGPVRPGPSWRS